MFLDDMPNCMGMKFSPTVKYSQAFSWPYSKHLDHRYTQDFYPDVHLFPRLLKAEYKEFCSYNQDLCIISQKFLCPVIKFLRSKTCSPFTAN